jgi:hypothetical protein
MPFVYENGLISYQQFIWLLLCQVSQCRDFKVQGGPRLQSAKRCLSNTAGAIEDYGRGLVEKLLKPI